jgi:hypothetical protein
MAKKLVELENFFRICTVTENRLVSTPILYTKTATKVGSWQGHCISTEDTEKLQNYTEYRRKHVSFWEPSNGVFFTTYRLTEDGKLIVSAPTIFTKGTNIGRKNETTAFQQAITRMMTKFNDKVKDGATADRSAVLDVITFDTITARQIANPNRINVMALHNVKDNWRKVKFPCMVQPKLDGIHMVANCWGTLDLFSRGMSKKISQNHIREALQFLCEPEWRGFYITGEMWSADLSRQVIASIVGQEDDKNIKLRIPLHVFDVFSVDKPLTFVDRYELAKKVVDIAASPYIQLVEALEMNTREDLEKYYEKQLDLKMEGIVVRNVDSLYEFGVQKEIRSYGVMKYKPRQDAEFKIVGYKSGGGKMAKCIIFIMETAAGKRFSVAPAWPLEEREKALQNGDSYVGRMATVSFDVLSDTGIPVQPVLLQVHD